MTRVIDDVARMWLRRLLGLALFATPMVVIAFALSLAALRGEVGLAIVFAYGLIFGIYEAHLTFQRWVREDDEQREG